MRATLFVLTVFAMAGCGDDSDKAAKNAPTKAEYVQDVNRICGANRAQVQKIAQEEGARVQAGDISKKEAAVRVLERSLRPTQDLMARAARLARPPADEARLERFWTDLSNSIPSFKQLPAALRKNDKAKLERLTEDFLQVAAKTRPFARQYGLTACIPQSS